MLEEIIISPHISKFHVRGSGPISDPRLVMVYKTVFEPL
jgi:hypothetical protein